MCEEEEDLQRTQEVYHADERDLVKGRCHLLAFYWREGDGDRTLGVQWKFRFFFNDPT